MLNDSELELIRSVGLWGTGKTFLVPGTNVKNGVEPWNVVLSVSIFAYDFLVIGFSRYSSVWPLFLFLFDFLRLLTEGDFQSMGVIDKKVLISFLSYFCKELYFLFGN